jgi:hypothetical protein
VAGGAVTAADARACDNSRHAQAVRAHAHGRAPLVIGDSTMIFAAPVLGRLGLEADAKGCRGFAEGVRILAARRHAGTLPHVAVLALGANGSTDAGRIAAALRVLGPGRVLGLVTPRNDGGATAAMRAAARRHPERVLLIDWVRYSAPHGGWFGEDGLHVGQPGADAFAHLIRRRVAPVAFPPVRDLRVPRSARGVPACGTVRRGGRALDVYVPRGRQRITCARARELARGPALRPAAGWRAYDWRTARHGPWTWVLARRDRAVLVAVQPKSRRTAASTASAATRAPASLRWMPSGSRTTVSRPPTGIAAR